jgi:hypothetical protein
LLVVIYHDIRTVAPGQIQTFLPMPHQDNPCSPAAGRLGCKLPYQAIAVNDYPISGGQNWPVSGVVANLYYHQPRGIYLVYFSG